jgi:hypothetical protein
MLTYMFLSQKYMGKLKGVTIGVINLLLSSIKGPKTTMYMPTSYVVVPIKVLKKLSLYLSPLCSPFSTWV